MATYRPRVISLSKHEGQSFGFYLRVEQGEDGHLIRNLEMSGPAKLSGLKDGDRVLRVNGTFVDNMPHSQVVDLVTGSGMSVTFHVLDETAYKTAKADGVDLSANQLRPVQAQPTMNGVEGSAPKPKLCFLVKSKTGYGFSIKSIKGEHGMYLTDVSPSGVAEKAGVKANDRLLEVNGENVESATHEQIIEKVRASESCVMFLLVDEETDRYYKNKNIRVGASSATLTYLPHKPRIVHMEKGPDGYGYYLRADPKLKGHFIKDIDRGSPAEKVGLKDMDRLVAVEREEVDDLDHDQVVERIRRCGNRCSMLVVDMETDKMYKMGGVSPFLYWEEKTGSPPEDHDPAPKPIVEPAPKLIPTAEPVSAKPAREDYKPKLCKLEKASSGYGFHLNGIQGISGQYIKEVVKGGAADRAGLEDDDIVIEVNGVNVEESSHEEVVTMIRGSGDSLVLLVAEKKAYDYFKSEQIPITALLLTPSPAATSQTAMRLQGLKEEEEDIEGRNLEEKKEDEIEKPDTPPGQREATGRRTSVSSSSSNDSVDERL